MMADEEIRQDRALCDAATPGPWEHEEDSDTVAVSAAEFKRLGYGRLAGCDNPQTAAFVAASRTRWPAALDEVEQLRAEVNRMREALITARHPCAVAASYVEDRTIAIGLRMHAESCVAALRAIDAALAAEVKPVEPTR